MSDDIPAPAASVAPAAEVRPVAAHRWLKQRQEGPSQDGGGFKQSAEERDHDQVAGAAAVLAVNEPDVPPALRGVFQQLLAELERLRGELDVVRQREHRVEGQADYHPVIPVLHRRAFLRQIGHAQDVSRRAGGLPGALVYIHFAGMEAIRDQYGLAASDSLLRHMANQMAGDLRQTDYLGYLDGGDFAIALTVTDADAAVGKARQLAEKLGAQPFYWEGIALHPAVRAAAVLLRDEVTPEDLLTQLDAVRRGVPTEDAGRLTI